MPSTRTTLLRILIPFTAAANAIVAASVDPMPDVGLDQVLHYYDDEYNFNFTDYGLKFMDSDNHNKTGDFADLMYKLKHIPGMIWTNGKTSKLFDEIARFNASVTPYVIKVFRGAGQAAQEYAEAAIKTLIEQDLQQKDDLKDAKDNLILATVLPSVFIGIPLMVGTTYFAHKWYKKHQAEKAEAESLKQDIEKATTYSQSSSKENNNTQTKATLSGNTSTLYPSIKKEEPRVDIDLSKPTRSAPAFK